MDSFTFYNPGLVRRVGTALVVGTSILLVILAIMLSNIARGNYDNIAAELETIARAERAATQGTTSSDPSFYVADTPQLAQSQMQTDMQALARQNQVDLEVIRAEQIEQINGALRMSLTMNGVVFESQLGAFLNSMATHEPMIVIENISLRRARSNPRGVDNRPLAIRLTLSGFAAQ